jgi:hypothetical protein
MDCERNVSLITTGLSLTQRCTIERNAATDAKDSWNQPVRDGWATHIEDQPCRFWAMSRGSGEHVTDTATVFVLEDLRLILQLGTDVTTSDRIASISLADGTEVDGGPIGIRAILPHRDFLELVLVRID